LNQKLPESDNYYQNYHWWLGGILAETHCSITSSKLFTVAFSSEMASKQINLKDKTLHVHTKQYC